MTIGEYEKICLQFAHDTRDWNNLNGKEWYKTCEYGNRYWQATDDGGDEDGIDLRWAFHKTDDYIKSHIYEEFLNLLIDSIECAAENCDLDEDTELVMSFLRMFQDDGIKRYVEIDGNVVK